MGEIPELFRAKNGSDMEPSGLHREDLRCDIQVREAVRNEGGVGSTHHA